MAHKTMIGGTNYGITGGKTMVDGTNYHISKGRTLIDGTGYDISFGKSLSEYAEGDIVYIPEDGTMTTFYVAKHNYESELNGDGRTLLVRADNYQTGPWHYITTNTGYNAYASSDIDTWMNNDYKALLSSEVQDKIGTTSFYYTIGATDGSTVDKTVSVLSRSIFTLSYTEYGQSYSSSTQNVEGTALPIYTTLINPSLYTRYWTRTPYLSNIARAFIIKNASDSAMSYYNVAANCGYRPAFTLPQSTSFDPDTNEIL